MDANCLFRTHTILIYYICIREDAYRRKPAERSQAKRGGSADDIQDRFHSKAPCAGKSNSYCRVGADQLGIERVASRLLLDTPDPLFVGSVRPGARGQPCFKIARRFLKKPAASYLQEDAADQRFNQILAVSMLGASLLSFILDLPVLGYLFSAFVFTAASVALLGFCVGCFIRYQLMMRRTARSS